jgi:hypothetical protein
MYYRIAAWVILAASFLILAGFYSSLPPEVEISRNLDGSASALAPKSLFTVFRVPLIELACAAAIAIMLRAAAPEQGRSSYVVMWTILLLTVALKSLFQTFESVSGNASLFYFLTIAVVAVGIISAAIPAMKVFTTSDRGHWKLRPSEQIALAGLLLFYIAVAIVPSFIWN